MEEQVVVEQNIELTEQSSEVEVQNPEISEDEKLQRRVQRINSEREIMEYLVGFMCAAMFLLIPLYMKNKYFGIGACKYDVYKRIMFACMPLLLGSGVWYLYCIRGEIRKGWLKTRLSIVDKTVIGYLLCVVISFFLSDYKTKAVWGQDGWYMGLISQISFVLLYFFVSRFCKYGRELLVLLCCVSAIVYILGILNRFLIDPLGVYTNIDAKYQLEFLSTLGQSSWYSSFMCTVLPIGIYFFWSADKAWKCVLSGAYCVLGFSTLVTQNSDSAFIALGCLLLTLLCFSIKDGKKMSRFYWVVLFLLVATRLMNLCTYFLNTVVIEQLETISYFLIKSPVLWWLMLGDILCILIQTYLNKYGKYSVRVGLVIRTVILVCVVSSLVLSITILYLSGTGKLPEGIAKITNQIPYLTWNDLWGNRRGASWRITWQMFTEMSPLKKLFGLGPDGYPHYIYSLYKDELDVLFHGLTLSNAHNEWYNAMINYGVIGGGAYLAIFIGAIVCFAKKASMKSEAVGVVLVLVSYMGHNLFCYQQVLCTPFVFCILGMGQWCWKQMEMKDACCEIEE